MAFARPSASRKASLIPCAKLACTTIVRVDAASGQPRRRRLTEEITAIRQSDDIARADGASCYWHPRAGARNGSSMNERARFVIGADGLHSLVACALGHRHIARAMLPCVERPWSGFHVSGAELHTLRTALCGVPTKATWLCDLSNGPKKTVQQCRPPRRQRTGQFRKALELVPGLADARTRGGHRAETKCWACRIAEFLP